MSDVYIVARETGRTGDTVIHDYVIQDRASNVLHTSTTYGEAIEWAKSRGHRPLLERVHGRRDTSDPDQWKEG